MRYDSSPTMTTDLADGQSFEVKGSGSRTYAVRNDGGVYSCSCPAWLNQRFAIERRTCKHLKALRGEEAERLRVGGPLAALGTAPAPVPPAPKEVGSLPLPPSNAPPVLLAHAWESDVDPTGWWLSEKLDGVRAYWDGTRLLSRLGKTFHAPAWFIDALPTDMHLDGELFAGRKQFQRAVGIVRRQDGADWKEITFVLFDAPRHGGPFEARIASLVELVERVGVSHLRAHPHARCDGVLHLRSELERVEALGGEGLMIRKPGSAYESGRSSTLLKVKTFHDAEARVVGHSPGTGKHKGRLGALECVLPNGKAFSVGTGFSDAEREAPPPIGTVITFRYQELTDDGIPRFPSWVGVRDDVAWPVSEPAPEAPAEPIEAAAAVVRAIRTFAKGDLTWQISLEGASCTMRQRRGLAVKATTTPFPSPAAAWRDADLQIAAKLAEGWAEVID